jgi:hypothetical protein
MWFNLAASQGDEVAAKNRDEIQKQMTPEQLQQAQLLARTWLAKHPGAAPSVMPSAGQAAPAAKAPSAAAEPQAAAPAVKTPSAAEPQPAAPAAAATDSQAGAAPKTTPAP